ncbi:hypothetical protein EXS74_01140 [Candidatus Woesearchaeota archaeon]|nr:hypothetical protein [Candidatus Woesearchaeota archaeon]
MTVYTAGEIMESTREIASSIWMNHYSKPLPRSLETTISLAGRRLFLSSVYLEGEMERDYTSDIGVGYQALESVLTFWPFRKKIEVDSDQTRILKKGREDLQVALWRYHVGRINLTLEKLKL